MTEQPLGHLTSTGISRAEKQHLPFHRTGSNGNQCLVRYIKKSCSVKRGGGRGHGPVLDRGFGPSRGWMATWIPQVEGDSRRVPRLFQSLAPEARGHMFSRGASLSQSLGM